ncbi:MAG TPA: hypothetical protein VMT38_10995 [Terracidiphilus sp.]|nr:hypothetical protein [Terracidiphilus sp.]
MQAYSAQFGGGGAATLLNPLILVAMLIAIALIFVLPRRFVIVPLLITIFLTPQGQQIYVGGVHLFVSRILILAAFIRAVTSRAPGQKWLLSGGWVPIDTATISSVVIVAVATMIRFGSAAAVINQLGYLWDDVLGYLALRSLIQDERDTLLAIKSFASLAIIFSLTMYLEQVKMMNFFGLFGGVNLFPEVRDGKIRSQGVFQHSLTAGAFGGTAIPLFIILWKTKKSRLPAAVGAITAFAMVYFTQTSTSLLTAAAAVLGILLWPLRKKMRSIRLSLVGGIIALALVMKAPVWFIIAHIDLTGSSSSYHRAELIDQCVNHFSNWWLMGTSQAASWGWDMWDTQDMYVSVAEAGGLAALVFYILVISRSFSRIGRARKRADSPREEWLFWLLGAALFAHVVAFFGVNYFDQSRMAWFVLLAMVCACSTEALSRKREGVSAKVTMRVKFPWGRLTKWPAAQPKKTVAWLQSRSQIK